LKRMVSLRRAVAAGAVATIAGGLLTGTVVYHVVHPSGRAGEIYDVLRQADSISQHYFVGEDYTTDDLINGALTGYAQGLGDRWTSYMTPEYYQSYQESSADSTVGIGVTVSYLENDDGTHYLYVNTVAADSPAQKAGIGYYDKITSINGKSIDDFGSYEKAVAEVRGKAGGVVELGMHQYATDQDVTLSVTRAEYEQIHVTSRMLDNHIGYIRIEKFADNTDEQFNAAVKEMQKQGATSLLFDLRNNPGGQLTALVNCLDTLLPEGKIISLKDKAGKTEEYTSDASEVDLPMAVLVNADSYSAAEFFAAALQEYGKATIVGEKTVGKGYSQQGFELSNGGCLNISTHCYYTPKGISLIGKGVTPDEQVDLSDEKKEHFYVLSDSEDDQMQAAISALEK